MIDDRKNPTFSIIIPVYNAGAILDKFRFCVNSVFDQVFSDWELIFVDDASTDDTVTVLREYERHDSRVRVHCHESNLYIGAARNSGTALARGRYVLYVDYDDYLYPDALSTVSEHIRNYDQPEAVQFAHLNLSNERPTQAWLAARQTLHWHRRRWRPQVYRGKEIFGKFLLGHLAHTPWCRVLRTDIAQKIKFPSVWTEDWPHAHKLFARLNELVVIRNRLYMHLDRPDSAFADRLGKQMFDSCVRVYRIMEDDAEAGGFEKIWPTGYRYFRTRRLVQIAHALSSYQYGEDDWRVWQEIAEPKSLSFAYLFYYLFDSLRARPRLSLRLKEFGAVRRLMRPDIFSSSEH